MARKKKFKREHFVFDHGNIHEVWVHPNSWADCMALSKIIPHHFGPDYKFRSASVETIQRLKENQDKTFEDLYRNNNYEAS